MQNHKYVLAIPAYGGKLGGFEKTLLSQYKQEFSNKFKIASDILGKKLEPRWLIEKNASELSELESLQMTHIFSCIIGNKIRQEYGNPLFIVGFSSGQLAGLYCNGNLSFEETVQSISDINAVVCDKFSPNQFEMVVITGLNDAEVACLCRNNGVYIANENTVSSYSVIGETLNIRQLTEAALDSGAIGATKLSVRLPFHSVWMEANRNEIKHFFNAMNVKKGVCPILSCVNQKTLTTKDQVVDGIIDNICSSVSWPKTVKKLSELGATTIFETGPGNSISRMSRSYCTIKVHSPQLLLDTKCSVATEHRSCNLAGGNPVR